MRLLLTLLTCLYRLKTLPVMASLVTQSLALSLSIAPLKSCSLPCSLTLSASPTHSFPSFSPRAQVDLNAQNLVSTASKTRKEWGLGLKRMLPGFSLLTSVQLVGVCLYVFARNGLVDHVRDVEVAHVKTGAGGKVGNKGGVAVRLKLHTSRICFVCSHLAAGKSHIAERNQDAADIARRLDFGKGRGLDSHDYVFWAGDLNYRVELPNEECRAHCAAGAYERLLGRDQLALQRGTGAAFDDYHEGPLTFPPTYKYDLFSDAFDTSEKQRVPSWTDRVLYRGERAKLLHYGSCDALRTSDHRPVLAVLELPVESVDPGAEAVVREEVMRSLRRRMATVAVTCRDVVLCVDEVQDALRDCGSIAMVDQLEGGMTTLVTFESPAGAEQAVTFHGRPMGCSSGPVDVILVSTDGDVEFDLASLNSSEGGSSRSSMPHISGRRRSDDNGGPAAGGAEPAERCNGHGHAAEWGGDQDESSDVGTAAPDSDPAAAQRNQNRARGSEPTHNSNAGADDASQEHAELLAASAGTAAATADTRATSGSGASPSAPCPASPPPSYFHAMGGSMPRAAVPPPRPKPPSRSVSSSTAPEPAVTPSARLSTATAPAKTLPTTTVPLEQSVGSVMPTQEQSRPVRPPPPVADATRRAAVASSESCVPPPRSKRPSAAAATSTGTSASGGGNGPPPRPSPPKSVRAGESPAREAGGGVRAVPPRPGPPRPTLPPPRPTPPLRSAQAVDTDSTAGGLGSVPTATVADTVAATVEATAVVDAVGTEATAVVVADAVPAESAGGGSEAVEVTAVVAPERAGLTAVVMAGDDAA